MGRWVWSVGGVTACSISCTVLFALLSAVYYFNDIRMTINNSVDMILRLVTLFGSQRHHRQPAHTIFSLPNHDSPKPATLDSNQTPRASTLSST